MNSSTETSLAARARQMTICRKSFARRNNCYVFFPEIHLSGKWLEECSFKSGQVINIDYEERRLIITVIKENKFEDE